MLQKFNEKTTSLVVESLGNVSGSFSDMTIKSEIFALNEYKCGKLKMKKQKTIRGNIVNK